MAKQYAGLAFFPGPDDIGICRAEPMVISVLNHSKSFGHTDLVIC
jgi:hypothetical protein